MQPFAGTIAGFALAAGGVLVPAVTGNAEPPPPVAAQPISLVPPPEGNGVPFDANPLVDVSRASLDLSAFGYVEEEFLVSGQANVYQYGPTGAVEVQTTGVPYTTRILVRRPANPRRFSGNVRVDTAHPQFGGNTFAWSADYILANGDAFVSITTRRGGFSAIEAMKAFDPVRYAPLDFTEDGLNWDVMAQVGSLLKTQIPANPLHGYDVERLYTQGWSGGGALLLIYVSDGFHERVRMPDGGPIFDGYLVGEPSGYPRINSTTPAIPSTDPRQQVQPIDVPAITLHSRPQESFRRRPDGNAPDDRYRVYEIAGATHANLRVSRAYDQPEDAFLVGGPFGCVHPISRFPFHHYFQSTMARLDAWSARGVTPPPSQRLALNPDGTVMLDEHGNDAGGVRSTQLDVPTARYFANVAAPGGQPLCTGADAVGAQEQFSAEKLDQLYRSHGGYVSRVVRRVNELARDGWLLPADAREVRVEAAHFDGI